MIQGMCTSTKLEKTRSKATLYLTFKLRPRGIKVETIYCLLSSVIKLPARRFINGIGFFSEQMFFSLIFIYFCKINFFGYFMILNKLLLPSIEVSNLNHVW